MRSGAVNAVLWSCVDRGTPHNLQIFRPADGHVKVSDETVGNGIDPAVDRELLAACPGVEHEDIRGHVSHLPNDVELASRSRRA